MRIIAGERRGRRIAGPPDDVTRPTSDLVREAMFNILAGRVEGREVIDLFAGSGALGLEALSRGAASAVFVEINRYNVATIRSNIAALGYDTVARTSNADAHRFGRSLEPHDRPRIVFLDPPYVEYQRHADKISDLITTLISKCAPGSTLVVESGKHWNASILPEPERWDLRRYGGTVVAFLRIDGEDEANEDEAEGEDGGIESDGGEA